MEKQIGFLYVRAQKKKTCTIACSCVVVRHVGTSTARRVERVESCRDVT